MEFFCTVLKTREVYVLNSLLMPHYYIFGRRYFLYLFNLQVFVCLDLNEMVL